MPKIDTADDFMSSDEKKNFLIPDISIGEFELEMYKAFKIKKEDIKNVLNLNIPDSLPEINDLIKKQSSIQTFVGLIYKHAFRKARIAEDKLNEYHLIKREKCLQTIKKRREGDKSKLGAKQITKEDVDCIFLELFRKDEIYRRIKETMNRYKALRDKWEVVYDTIKQRNFLLVAFSENVRLLYLKNQNVDKGGKNA